MSGLSRRGLLGAIIAAPAIVRASSLMPVKQMFGMDLGAADATVAATYSGNGLLTIQEITREAVRLWANSNEFIKTIDREYETLWPTIPAKERLLIRLPPNFSTN